jgi:hypothetical protein
MNKTTLGVTHMPTINRGTSGTYAVSSDKTTTKQTVTPRKTTKRVVVSEQSDVVYTKLPTKRLTKIVSMEKISKKRR